MKTFSRLKPGNVFNFVRKAKFVVGLRRAVEFAIGISYLPCEFEGLN